jgi:hypothetical protein
MTDTSDTVIIGTVTAQLDDRLLVAIAGETPAMRFLRFEVTPDEILTGSLETPTIVIEIDEYYARYVDDTPWSQIGQTSLLFLREKLGSAETLYLPINSQGIYRIDSQGQLKGARASDALVK